MFVDFNRVFKDKPQTEIAVPEALISYLNTQLPEGVKYKIEEDGTCNIASTGGPVNIGGFEFHLTEEQKKILGDHFSKEDLMNYFYNAQKSVPLNLKKDGMITLNGKEFSIDKISFHPMKPIHYENGTLWMLPQPFEPPFKLMVGCEKYERELLISRVPNESVHVELYESEKSAPLYLKYQLDKKNGTLKVNISYNITYAKTIRDIVESTSIYNAYLEGKGYLAGHELGIKPNGKKIKPFDKDSIAFWKKVLEIEEYLGVSFEPPQDDVGFETMCLVETLYQNLINKTPVIDKEVISSINGGGEWLKTKEELEEMTGKPIYLEFEATTIIELFGVELKLPALLGIFNSIFAGLDGKGEEQKIILKDESEQKRRYTSILRFKTEEEVQEFKKSDYNQRVTLLHDAKKVQEYLRG